MFIDINSLDERTGLEADICIIGAGPAAISMARDFIGTPVRVLLLESGDIEFDGDTQELYASDSVGIPYFALDQSRLRYFGGSSNHWDNWCGEFEPIDFRQRSWVPDSGWPFGLEELLPITTAHARSAACHRAARPSGSRKGWGCRLSLSTLPG